MTDTPVSAEAPAPDLVKLLLFRSSDEAGIGWTPNTVVHVPAGLLHNAAETITALRAEVERLKAIEADYDDHEREMIDLEEEVVRQAATIERLTAALRGAYEVFAGSDGFIPETAAEGYQQQIIKQMVDCISAALKEDRT